LTEEEMTAKVPVIWRRKLQEKEITAFLESDALGLDA
jgi:hypothetical protein